MKTNFKKPYKKSEKLVQLHTIRCTDAGGYSDTVKLIPKSAVPDEARRVFGSKCDFALVDFGPNYPEWYDPKTCKGFGAVGYHQYFTDTRISNAFDNVGEEEKIKWDSLKKWLIIGGAALIFVFVVMRFL